MKRTRGFVLTLEDDDVVSQSGSESEIETDGKSKKRKRDNELNLDFEFDSYGVLDGIKGVDEEDWGFKSLPGMKDGAGVDLDVIISRRRTKLNKEEEIEDYGGKVTNDSDGESANESEETEGNGEFLGFDDDEIG